MKKHTILVAEDEILIGMAVKQFIVKLGHTVIGVATSGSEVLEFMGVEKPDIIFMDINMSHMLDGIVACRTVKKQHPGIKVYFVSAYGKDLFKDELKSCSHDGYINKSEYEQGIKKALY